MNQRVYLSPPHMTGIEQEFIADAFASNWVAPLGPHVDAFEQEFAARVDMPHAAALSSGTAALHLALQLVGVGANDIVFVSSFTFAASVYPIRYLGAIPHFIDSDATSWNMDPLLLAEALASAARAGRLPKGIVVVDLYGHVADMDEILALANQYGIPVIEDAAEALGAAYKGRPAGSLAAFGAFSFNGNKIITTSGGGMLVSRNGAAVQQARKLATQAREPAPHYEHREIGYNYRLSNLLAAVGRGQLQTLDERVRTRRANFDYYAQTIGSAEGIELMPEAPWCTHSRWLTCITIDPERFGADRETVRLALEGQNIESRPLWKPMHLQPVFREFGMTGSGVSDRLFDRGLCLPSGSSLTVAERQRVCEVLLAVPHLLRRNA